jgi:hypothetical protein
VTVNTSGAVIWDKSDSDVRSVSLFWAHSTPVASRQTRTLSVMIYSIALRVFAFALALICIGLMALVAHSLPASGTVVRLPRAIDLPVPHWPDLMLRSGTVCLLVSFVVLIATCCMIASV